jgi:hypothetical protein
MRKNNPKISLTDGVGVHVGERVPGLALLPEKFGDEVVEPADECIEGEVGLQVDGGKLPLARVPWVDHTKHGVTEPGQHLFLLGNGIWVVFFYFFANYLFLYKS